MFSFSLVCWSCCQSSVLANLARLEAMDDSATIAPSQIFDPVLSGPATPECSSIFPLDIAARASEPGPLPPSSTDKPNLTMNGESSPSETPVRKYRRAAPSKRSGRKKKHGIEKENVPQNLFPCQEPECVAKMPGYGRQEHLNRHVQTKHEGRSYRCSCNKTFNRKDNLHQHRRRLHPTDVENKRQLEINESVAFKDL